MFDITKKEKGISLLFIVLIMGVILSIALGVSSILIQQIGTIGEVGDSVISFYAADSGIEQELYDVYQLPDGEKEPYHEVDLDNEGKISYVVTAKCGASVLECPTNFEKDLECDALNYCIKSIGGYQETKRAIEIKY